MECTATMCTLTSGAHVIVAHSAQMRELSLPTAFMPSSKLPFAMLSAWPTGVPRAQHSKFSA